MPDEPRVLILGGGFAGVGAALELKGAAADVVVVDANDYHTFQPLLYQVATGLLEQVAVGHPIRGLFHDHENVSVHQATTTAIELDERRVRFAEMDPISYDHLVLALGAKVNYFGVEGAAEHAFPLYTLQDAVRLQQHLLRRWEAADRSNDLMEDGALNVVIVGGGATGIETAGALAELYHHTLREDYPHVPVERARLILVEAGPELFPMFSEDIRTYAHEALEERGVEVLTGEIVQSVTPTRVALKSGTVLDAHTLVWGAGLQAHPITATLGLDLEKGGRIAVEPDLSIPGHPEAFAVGDLAWITDAKTGQVLPQLGSVALQSGTHAGATIGRLIDGHETEPFAYHDKGTMATIGRGAGVVELPGGRTLKGRTAWLAWGAVHLALLSTGEDRTKAVLDWTWSGFTHDRSERIIVEPSGR